MNIIVNVWDGMHMSTLFLKYSSDVLETPWFEGELCAKDEGFNINKVCILKTDNVHVCDSANCDCAVYIIAIKYGWVCAVAGVCGPCEKPDSDVIALYIDNMRLMDKTMLRKVGYS